MRNKPRQRRFFRRFDEFEIKELKKTATADREGVARHPVLIELCDELQSMGFSPLAIAEGLAIRANTLRAEGQAQLTNDAGRILHSRRVDCCCGGDLFHNISTRTT